MAKEMSDWRGKMLAKLRAIIKQADPEAVEELKWRDVPVWSHDGILCTGETYKSVVKMTFAKGASLPDPSGLFNASLEGNTRRAIDVREGDKVDDKALKALIRAAVALNQSKTKTKIKTKKKIAVAHRVQSFPPIAERTAETLILGSMPGEASLAAGQYYAHPQNAFWRIMGSLLRIDPALPYASRVRALKTAKIAVWDVLHSCSRPGSLDSSIDRETLEPNDFASFFRAHPRIRRVFFNGSTAETCFNRHVKDGLVLGRVGFLRLPSTSPAHAARSFEDKLNAWRVVLPKT